MRFVSFFAGIGGFDLGLERAGHECVGQVEIDPYALGVLEKHWPNVPRFGDIRTLDAATLPDAELWCGGFPCQPFSVAGKRGGTDDKRDLWPAWFALVARRRPQWIFGENVPGLLSAEGGKAWGRVLRDLASVGYVAEWTVLSARDVGAPHRRERLWIVAESAYAAGYRLEAYPQQRVVCEPAVYEEQRARRFSEMGFAGQWLRPRPIGARPVGVGNGIPSDVDRLRCLGNAVVPQVVEAIARKVWG